VGRHGERWRRLWWSRRRCGRTGHGVGQGGRKTRRRTSRSLERRRRSWGWGWGGGSVGGEGRFAMPSGRTYAGEGRGDRASKRDADSASLGWNCKLIHVRDGRWVPLEDYWLWETLWGSELRHVAHRLPVLLHHAFHLLVINSTGGVHNILKVGPVVPDVGLGLQVEVQVGLTVKLLGKLRVVPHIEVLSDGNGIPDGVGGAPAEKDLLEEGTLTRIKLVRVILLRGEGGGEVREPSLVEDVEVAVDPPSDVAVLQSSGAGISCKATGAE
jgi:hypothetical protein